GRGGDRRAEAQSDCLETVAEGRLLGMRSAWSRSVRSPGGTSMAQPLLSDALWQRMEPLLPPLKPRRFRFPGRKPLAHRQALTGILFALRTGIRWNDLPCEMGCGSGSACRKRLHEWQQMGIWDEWR